VGVLLILSDSTASGTYTMVGNDFCAKNAPPVAALQASPRSGTTPLQVHFDASASSDPDKGDSVASYTFFFGDGSSPFTTSKPRITHTYDRGGTYRATVEVTDTRGMQSGNAASVTITAVHCSIKGTNGNDVLVGTAGDDVICGEGGNDVLRGLGGDDVLIGGLGDDKLVGRNGNDTLNGGEGDDRLAPGAGDDVVDGGTGRDGVIYRGSAAGVSVDLAEGTALGVGSDRLRDLENAVGTKFDDVLRGTGGPNVLTGVNGDDVIRGRGGDDVIRGGLGADRLVGGAGTDIAIYPFTSGVYVNLATGEAHRGGGHDHLIHIENVSGTRHADTLIGSSGSNELLGQAGSDSISGKAGDDVLNGGRGRDTIDGGRGSDRCLSGEAETSCEG
jgi:Ca2+-binding RTX toxin-like protein